ncbi:MAG: hypothetical protein H8E31_07985 [Planctomycetes bacterium]|nr:hypothetical protein [Planctomycetota bacterium]
MEGFRFFLLLLVAPVGVFLAWKMTEDKRQRRQRILLVLLGAAYLGFLAHQESTEAHWSATVLITASTGVPPALLLAFIGRERLPLAEALACLILAILGLFGGLVLAFECGLIWI